MVLEDVFPPQGMICNILKKHKDAIVQVGLITMKIIVLKNIINVKNDVIYIL